MLMCMWPLCALLPLLLVPVQPLDVPQILSVYTEDPHDLGSWNLYIKWRPGFNHGVQSEGATYDLEIFHSEQMRCVYNGTVDVQPDENGAYRWTWTSPLPLQCTSHSVRLRLRDHAHHSDWSALFTLNGTDTKQVKAVYPQNHKSLVDQGIIFCCILDHQVNSCNFSDFTIQISNRTCITERLRYPGPSPSVGLNLDCMKYLGTTFHTGYAPEVHGLICQTPDLRSVECQWSSNRSVGFNKEISKVRYSINGRNCPSNTCVLDGGVDSGVTNWTLTAENILGKMVLVDIADPKYRVRLRAPTDARAVVITARNATLQWKWDMVKDYSTFPMTCQVEVNDQIWNETFTGPGLQSLLLLELQPFTQYTARVRCGSKEHFHAWGDWSDSASFLTGQDIPEAVDVWMQDLDGQTYVVWKALTPAQSHGPITGFQMFVEKTQRLVNKTSNEFCHKLTDGGNVSVSASNSAFTSPASTLLIPLQPDSSVNVTRIAPHNGGFYLTWDLNPDSTCGYIVDWYPTYNTKPCDVNWIKFPPGVSKATIYSDFEAGLRYTLSVYTCTPSAPQLLQRREGYIKELPPSGRVQIVNTWQQGSTLHLSWDEVPTAQQNGFLTGYKVSYVKVNGDESDTVTVIKDPDARQCAIRVHPDQYRFTVKALTAGGEGRGSEVSVSMDTQIEKVIIICVVVLAAGAGMLIFLYRKRNRLKPVLYPDIPKPKLSQAWTSKALDQGQLINDLLKAEKEVINKGNTELHVQTTSLLQGLPEESLSPEFIPRHDPPQREPLEICAASALNYITPVIPIPMDPCYMEVPFTGIQNPTYDMAVSCRDKDNTVVVTGYRPQV